MQKPILFFRRAAAFGVDLIFLVAVSLVVVVLTTLVLSYIRPERYENPIGQISRAIESRQPIHMEFGFFRAEAKKEKVEGEVVLGEGLGWVYEVFVVYLYFILCFRFGGRTLGKRIFGLRVVKSDGSKLTVWNAVERTHGYVFSASILFIGFFQVFWDSRRLTLHDKVADTTVIRCRR